MDRIGSAIIDFTEAAYDLESDDEEWLPTVLRRGLPVLDQGLGVACMEYELPPEGGAPELKSVHVGSGPEDFVERQRPEFILFQCGADSIAGDPITHLRYTPAAHAHAAGRLCRLAERHCNGRLLAMGGGGYNRDNLARAWCAVLAAMTAAV